MKVKVKILFNRADITEANEQNLKVDSHNAQQQGFKAEEKNILLKKDVPEPDVREMDLFIDVDKITLAGENEHGMVSVIYDGRDYQFVKTDELMNALEERFK